MSDSRTLYEKIILDHYKSPRNYGKPEQADATADGLNPRCGDTLKLYLCFSGDTIASACFEGQGCALSKSSASLMTTVIQGRTRTEALALSDAFHALLTSEANAPVDEDTLGELRAFAGVREFPMRVKCAMLAWDALRVALTPRRPDSTQHLQNG